jgi:large subunit ribosomal protein L28
LGLCEKYGEDTFPPVAGGNSEIIRLKLTFIDRSGIMSRVCFFTGKRTRAGQSIARRGKAKYLGGVGRKITGISKRKFKPNIQKVRALVDGKVVRIKVSAKAIRNGLVVKPPRRNWKPAEAEAVS